MSSRKKKKKRDKKKRSHLLKPRLPQGFEDTVVIESPPGQKKMSEVLLDFVEPYSDQWRNEAELRTLLNIATLVWNASLLTGSQREEAIQDMIQAVPPEGRVDFRRILDDMIQRKMALFAGNKRAILSFEVSKTPTGPYVSVISSLDPG
jgi:hypothetical protein